MQPPSLVRWAPRVCRAIAVSCCLTVCHDTTTLSASYLPWVVERPHFVGKQHYMLPLLVDVVSMVCCCKL